jgi:hypothetical protein
MVRASSFSTIAVVLLGGLMRLYVVWFGAYYAGEDITWTFIVNEFEAEGGETQ